MRVRSRARLSTQLQRADIAAGQEKLRLAVLGERLDPFFTPPWNS